jgi:HTH-type transcriptional regulator/antitoxin HipB
MARRKPAPDRPSMLATRLGAAIRTRRRELALTQQQLAELAGCGLAFLYDLERGKRSVRLDKVLEVLEVLGLELHVEEGRGGLEIGPPHLREGSRS